jgi:23S rRNA (pseudouridine1915-N3)-methyltransferase
MKIQLIVTGKTFQDFVLKGFEDYCTRLKHYLPFETKVIPDIKNTKNLSVEQQKEKEGELILKHIQPDDFVVLLDERGKSFTSVGFAEYLEKKMQLVPKRLVFIVGGPYGFSQKIYGVAHDKMALSQMTFSHQLIRLVFAEQLYRAMTILNREPYHHE